MNNTGRGTTCWIAWCSERSSAATLRAQHEEIHGRGSKGRLLRSGSSQAVKHSSCRREATTSTAFPCKVQVEVEKRVLHRRLDQSRASSSPLESTCSTPRPAADGGLGQPT